MKKLAVVAVMFLGGASHVTAWADPVPATPLALPPPIPAPRDTPFPGHVTLAVDATDLARHVMSVHERIPVPSGTSDMVLLYPKWVPGDHGPTGPLEMLAGLTVHANGTVIPWRRDAVATEAFHVAVPQGATAIDVDFEFTSPATAREGRVVMTPEMIDLSWNDVALYPAGYFTRDIPFDASVKLPAGWKIGTALTPTGTGGDTPHFATVPFDRLVDSPLLAGRYVAQFDLGTTGGAPVHLDVAADRPSELKVSDAQLAAHRALVTQAARLYGSHHYDHYDFLLFLSDELSGQGLEHHRSSEDGVGGGYFRDWDKDVFDRDLLPHEYTHSWNGKYKRPADLWAPDFSIPERDSLLWVYEGQTQYWGQVLAARSGLWTRENALSSLAYIAALLQDQQGRLWRPLEDTTASAIVGLRRPLPWGSWSRGEEYYEEGQLTWLDADTLIRQKTGGHKSLDDFAKLFFGTDDGWFGEKPFQFDDVVHALNEVVPYDWASFLRKRIYDVAPTPPLDGITRGGYKLVFDDKESAWEKSLDSVEDWQDFTFSIGLALKDTKVLVVEWGSPAWRAGLLQGDEIISIDGYAFGGSDDLEHALADAKGATVPMSFIVKSGEHVHTVSVDYHGGLRYPHLVRSGTGPALLDAILAAKK